MKTEVLPGVFTVNAEGKKVKFTRGNLFWDGHKFDLEENQYDFPTTRKSDHIGHFFWSKNAAVARAANYDDPSASVSDTFFAADGGAIEGFTVLTRDEWVYLFEVYKVRGCIINGIICAVLQPEDLQCEDYPESFTADEWKELEAKGFVAFPYTAWFDSDTEAIDGSEFIDIWTSSPIFVNTAAAITFMVSDDFGAGIQSTFRAAGIPIRLVQVQ